MGTVPVSMAGTLALPAALLAALLALVGDRRHRGWHWEGHGAGGGDWE